jgi:hypothetical protein
VSGDTHVGKDPRNKRLEARAKMQESRAAILLDLFKLKYFEMQVVDYFGLPSSVFQLLA